MHIKYKTNLKSPSWQKHIKDEWSKPYMQELEAFLDQEVKEGKKILPPKELWLEALNVTPLDKVKVLIGVYLIISKVMILILLDLLS